MAGIFAAARGIRPYLPQLIGPADAADTDAELAELLTHDERVSDLEQQLRVVLERRIETRMFLESVLDDEPHFRPPAWQDGVLKGAGFRGLPGDHSVVAPLFRCPVADDYDWRRPTVGTPVPQCPTHRVVLVRAGERATGAR